MNAPNKDLLVRFQRWLTWGIGLAVIFYVGLSMYVGLGKVADALENFVWLFYIPAILLTLFNYTLRFGKWTYLLGRLGIRIDWKENLVFFVAGLAMAISPGKAGELLKPYLVRVRTGVPMATTIPALITERLTDGIACLSLAAIGVGTYAAESAIYLFVPLILIAVGLAVLSSVPLSLWIIRTLGRFKVFAKITAKLEEMYVAMRACVAPAPLVITVVLSMVAWFAECVGYKLIFEGFQAHVPVGMATFIYAFSTAAGGATPGGLGVADSALQVLAEQLAGVSPAQALASAMLVRVATLWMGEILGAIALFRVGDLLAQEVD